MFKVFELVGLFGVEGLLGEGDVHQVLGEVLDDVQGGLGLVAVQVDEGNPGAAGVPELSIGST